MAGLTHFDEQVQTHQLAWRRKHIADQRNGTQNGKSRPWILPAELWEEGLWPGIRSGSDHSLPGYLAEKKVTKHRGVHNLKSSWMLCANLYFPFGSSQGLPILAGFLRQHCSPDIEAVESVELEYAESSPLDPQTLLGEPESGRRGANQTSPDVAFLVRTSKGKGLVLTENKLVEHSFYACSGRKPEVQNPDTKRCLDLPTLLADPQDQCWQLQWKRGARKNRKYWDLIRLSAHGRQVLTRCPAATGGYQLFRQQALAEGIAAGGRYDLVISCVAYDSRNSALRSCLRATGVDDFATGWGALFEGTAQFTTFTHQAWVAWVAAHGSGRRWSEWLSYIHDRYGYPDGRA